jgi:hypothetical protein
VLGGLLVLLAFLAAAGPVAAQGATQFPAPVVASIPPPEGATEDTIAATWFSRDPAAVAGDPIFVVGFDTPVDELPPGTRVSVVTGDPAGVRQRSSLYLDPAGPRGDVEVARPDGIEVTGPAEVAVTPEGQAQIRLATVPDSDVVWIEVEVPETPVTQSAIFPLDQVSGSSGPGALTAATTATVVGADNLPTGEYRSLPAVPTLEVSSREVIVRTTQPPPTEVDGIPVTSVRDYVRIAPDFGDDGQTPYFFLVDYDEPSVTYLDGSSGIPVEVPGDEALWLIDGLDPEETDTSSVTLDRGGLLEAVGLPADTPAAVGVARTVALDDGRYLQSEGALGTFAWFDESSGGVAPPTTADDATSTTLPPPTSSIDETAAADDGPDATVLIVAAVVAAGLAGVALLAARRNRRELADPDTALGAMAKVVDKTAHGDDGDDGGDGSSRSPRGGLRAPVTRQPASVADAVGVAGARAAVTREAEARAAADRAAENGGPDEVGRDGLYAAMRRKAAEAGDSGDAPEAPDDDSADSAEGIDADGESTTLRPDKNVRPDDALDALNGLIDDLPLPDDR